MLVRLLLTAVSLIVVAAAFLIIDCSSNSIELFSGDPVAVCSTLDSVGVTQGWWIGGMLGLLAVLLAFVVWAPLARPQMRKAEPTTSLMHNLGRLAGMRSLGHEPVPLSVSRSHLAELSRRLEIVETSLAADASTSRRATELWMRMLREANDLHNSGELTTDDFKQINTRLVGVFSPPGETRPDDLETSSASH